MLIKELKAKKIKDSRSEPTIEISVNGQKASSPSGKSKGKYETPPYYSSLENNIKLINTLKIFFEINSFQDLSKVEFLIKNKFQLKNSKQFGANALFALESAILKALAKFHNKELWQIINPNAKKIPIPVGNVVGGGLHSHNKDAPEFQEFLLIPQGKTMKEDFSIIKKIHAKLKTILKAKVKNDEGAWQSNFSIEEILKILSRFKNTRIGFDIAFC
jgi:enolase